LSLARRGLYFPHRSPVLQLLGCHEPGTSTFEVQNFQSVSIHSVWLAPAAHMLENLGTIDGCKQSTVVLTATSQPDVYFIDVDKRELGIDIQRSPAASGRPIRRHRAIAAGH
jgi:hypothetical protein